MQIIKDEIELRNWTQADAGQLREIADNKKIADFLTDSFPYPFTLNNAHDYIRKANDLDNKNLQLAICRGAQVVGSIGLFFQSDIYRNNAIIAYYIGEPYWGKGIATQAIQLLSDYAFDHYTLQRISAEPFATNIGSIKALEKAGYQREGILRKHILKNGQVLDSCLYARIS